MKIYLAGPMTGHKKEAVIEWRSQLWMQLHKDIKVVSPFRDKPYLDKGVIQESDQAPDCPFATSKGINGRDSFDVRTSDIVVACFLDTDKPSLGTAAEIWGAWLLNKPVIMIADKDNVHVKHPMINEACKHIVGSVDEAAFIVNSYFGFNTGKGKSKGL